MTVEEALKLPATAVVQAGDGKSVFVYAEKANDEQLGDLHRLLNEHGVPDTYFIVTNYPVKVKRVPNPPADAALLVWGEDLNDDQMDILCERMDAALPDLGERMIVSNFEIQTQVVRSAPEDGILMFTAEDVDEEQLEITQNQLAKALPNSKILGSNFKIECQVQKLEQARETLRVLLETTQKYKDLLGGNVSS